MMDAWATINIHELVNGKLTDLRNVIRFSNSTRIKDESVAEHSYFTAYFSLILAHGFMLTEGIKLDLGRLLSCAILHDIDESVTGDFVRHFKYSDSSLKQSIEKATSSLMHDIFKPLLDPARIKQYNGAPVNTLHTQWENAKDTDVLEGDIVAFADFLSVLSYVVNELECGNKKLINQLDDMYEYAASFYNRGFMQYEEPKAWLMQVMSILTTYGLKKED